MASLCRCCSHSMSTLLMTLTSSRSRSLACRHTTGEHAQHKQIIRENLSSTHTKAFFFCFLILFLFFVFGYVEIAEKDFVHATQAKRHNCIKRLFFQIEQQQQTKHTKKLNSFQFAFKTYTHANKQARAHTRQPHANIHQQVHTPTKHARTHARTHA